MSNSPDMIATQQHAERVSIFCDTGLSGGPRTVYPIKSSWQAAIISWCDKEQSPYMLVPYLFLTHFHQRHLGDLALLNSILQCVRI